MTLHEARHHYHNYVEGERGIYYMVSRERGYNQTDYQLFRIFGSPDTKEAIEKILGANPYCGGATFSALPEDKDFGEIFAVKVWGCD